MNQNITVCQECGREFDSTAVDIGEIISCPSCGAEYINTFKGFEILEFDGQDWGE